MKKKGENKTFYVVLIPCVKETVTPGTRLSLHDRSIGLI
jgi:hypothetical protein